MNKYKFVITGGHHNSALVVAKELVRLGHAVEWIGHRYAASGDRNDSAEYIEVNAAGIPFHNLVAGKSSFEVKNIYKIPYGLIQAFKLISRIHPDAIISFGGYLGLAVGIVGFIKMIPIYLHEQTVIAGKSNRIIAKLARKIYLTWPTSTPYYPSAKSMVVGLPLNPSFLGASIHQEFANSKPTLLFVCGKQGSHTINQHIFVHLSDLLAKYNIIHQTGMSSATQDYAKAVALAESLPPEISTSYRPLGYIYESEIATIMKSVDLVIGRSGAHTAYELGILGKKAILIPFMHTHGHEQLRNARILQDAGIATILPQSELTYPRLLTEIKKALHKPEVKPMGLPTEAAHIMSLDLITTLS